MIRRSRRWWVVAAVLFVLASGAMALVRARGMATPQGPQRQQEASGQQAPPLNAPTVAVGRLVSTEIPTTLSLTASVISLREAAVFSKVAGYLETVAFRPGDVVQTGQVVAVVEHSQLDAQVLNALAARRRADANLLNARAAVDRAQAQLAVAKANYSRATTLFEQGLVSQQAVDSSRGDLQTAQANLDAAQALVHASQADIEAADASLQSARLAQASATITAPWSGIVVRRGLDPGAYVTTSGGTPILTIADLDNVAVLVNVTEADMAAIRRGTSVTIGVDAYPTRNFQGTVTRIAGGVDPDTRTVQVEIDLDNPDHALRPGMYARARLTGATRRAFVAPLSALTTVGTQQFVWIVANGKASRRAVTIGATTASSVEIISGVGPDEVLVYRGTELVRDGGPVRTVQDGK